MTRHEEMLDLTRRALQHYRNGTTDQAPSVMSQPVAAYVDEARYQREVERVFKHLPQALALSIEIPQAGDYRAMQVLDVPVIVVRGKDGRARAFLNACRHRGAKVCQHGSGNARVFTCPYHAWAYNEQGALISRYAADTFGEVDHASLGLTELDCAERAGLVFVKLTPGEALDIDTWLGDFAAELGSLKLDSWHIYTQRELDGPGWKVALDGYLEAYHHNSLHGKTVGKMTIGNLLVLDTYGPHQRLTFGRKTLAELVDQPESSWEVDKHIRLIHNCFPNLSVSGILGDHCLVSQIFPGPTPTTTLTRQTVLVATPPVSEEQRAASELFSSMVLQAVRDEDYAVGRTIQDGLKSGANLDFLFGRNEPAVQNYHNTIARLMAGASR
ncbi:MAG: aromatic ring-hydroxylating dioxygenase subunit alpha [Proteobacteria bacterium]|nr:aromatic ring-hydroxylating dioxygenase subunit alpha [Pseudomonadota bacterium]